MSRNVPRRDTPVLPHLDDQVPAERLGVLDQVLEEVTVPLPPELKDSNLVARVDLVISGLAVAPLRPDVVDDGCQAPVGIRYTLEVEVIDD